MHLPVFWMLLGPKNFERTKYIGDPWVKSWGLRSPWWLRLCRQVFFL